MSKFKNLSTIILAVILAVLLGYFLLGARELKTPELKNLVKVYFVKYDEQNPRIEAVKRNVPSGDTKINVAVTELLKGPSQSEIEEGYRTEIPASAKLKSILQDDGKVIINLSKGFESGGGSLSMSIRTSQLTKTVNGAAGNSLVYLEIEGRQIEAVGGEGVMINQPLNKK